MPPNPPIYPSIAMKQLDQPASILLKYEKSRENRLSAWYANLRIAIFAFLDDGPQWQHSAGCQQMHRQHQSQASLGPHRIRVRFFSFKSKSNVSGRVQIRNSRKATTMLPLLVTQGIDRIQTRCLPGRVIAKRDAHGHRDRDRNRRGAHRSLCRPAHQQTYK
jgi:hypothetical protein